VIFVKYEHAANVWIIGSLSFILYIPKTADVHAIRHMWNVRCAIQ